MCSPRPDAEEIVGLCDRTPVLLVNRDAERTDCLHSDAADGLRQTIDYLAALGHARIAYVPGSEHSWSNARRVALAGALAAEAGLDLVVLGWQAETVAGGTAAAASVVASGASAVITHNDLVAFGVVKGARARRIHRHRTAPGLAGAALLVVDDVDAAPHAGGQRLRPEPADR